MLAGKTQSKNLLFLKVASSIFLAFIAFFIWPMLVSAAPDLIINEIMYDLSGADDKHEWIELYNAGPNEIDLTGFKINDGDDATNHGLNLPPKNGSRGSLVIPPFGYLLLADDAATVAADLPNYSGPIIDTVFTLLNSSATLKIIHKDGQEVCSAYYSKEMGAAGNGKTLEWSGTQFKESVAEGGTPGAPNSILSQSYSPTPTATATPSPSTPVETITPSPSTNQATSPTPTYQYSKEIFINEFLPYPQSGEKEWVEIYNTGEGPVNLTGWGIVDKENIERPQLIPDGTVIGVEDFLVVFLEKQILNNEGDQVKLLWPDGQILHSVSYQKAVLELSCIRLTNGQWVWTNQPTPGATNKEAVWETTGLAVDESPLPSIAPKQEQVAAIKSPPSTTPPPLVANHSDTPLPAATEPSPRTNLIAASEPQLEKSDNKTLFWLLAIIALSTLGALGLIYFKRRHSPDNSPPASKNQPLF